MPASRRCRSRPAPQLPVADGCFLEAGRPEDVVTSDPPARAGAAKCRSSMPWVCARRRAIGLAEAMVCGTPTGATLPAWSRASGPVPPTDSAGSSISRVVAGPGCAGAPRRAIKAPTATVLPTGARIRSTPSISDLTVTVALSVSISTSSVPHVTASPSATSQLTIVPSCIESASFGITISDTPGLRSGRGWRQRSCQRRSRSGDIGHRHHPIDRNPGRRDRSAADRGSRRETPASAGDRR